MSEKYGIRDHYVGEIVIDDDYGEGEILEISRDNPIKNDKRDLGEFIPGLLKIKFVNGYIKSVPSSVVESKVTLAD
jgi:hypothetical protein